MPGVPSFAPTAPCLTCSCAHRCARRRRGPVLGAAEHLLRGRKPARGLHQGSPGPTTPSRSCHGPSRGAADAAQGAAREAAAAVSGANHPQYSSQGPPRPGCQVLVPLRARANQLRARTSLRWALHRYRKADHACGWWCRLPQIKEHKRKVVITADTFCGVCRRRLGEHMFAVCVLRVVSVAFALPSLLAARYRYPNDTVVHMHCAQESLTCDPVTGTKFSQQKSIV